MGMVHGEIRWFPLHRFAVSLHHRLISLLPAGSPYEYFEDGRMKLGRIKAEPESAPATETEGWWSGKSGKTIAGGIMPPPALWWKRLLHLD